MPTNDQVFYDLVAEELRLKRLVDGVWIRAFSDAAGDEQKARAIYIKYRVAQLEQENLERIKKAEWTRQENLKRHKEEENRKMQEAANKAHQTILEQSKEPKWLTNSFLAIVIAIGVIALYAIYHYSSNR
jgi:uncharacterized membrane protein YdbT with pleckstrin-like domain